MEMQASHVALSLSLMWGCFVASVLLTFGRWHSCRGSKGGMWRTVTMVLEREPALVGILHLSVMDAWPKV